LAREARSGGASAAWSLSLLSALSALPCLVLPTGARAADPDWPCAQRLVPRLSAATLWAAPLPAADAGGRANPAIADIVAAVTPRDMEMEQGEAKLAAFADALPAPDRRERLAETFAALLEATNEERGAVIARIEALARRQRELGNIVAKVTDELRAIPPDAAGADAARRAEILDRRTLLIRSIDETQRTMRYACEVPTQLDARLGRYARLLQSKL